MLLSVYMAKIHQELKRFEINIKLYQAYELFAAGLGMTAYRYICRDNLVLCGEGKSRFPASFEANQILNQRCRGFNLTVSPEKLAVLLNEQAAKYGLYYAKAEDLVSALLNDAQDDEISLEQLLQHPIYRDINQAAENCDLKANVLKLIILALLRPAYFNVSEYLLGQYKKGIDLSGSPFYQDLLRFLEYKKFQNQINEILDYLILSFEYEEILPYLYLFGRLDEEDEYPVIVSAERGTLRNILVSTQSTENAHLSEWYSWYLFALKLGYADVLDGQPKKSYAVNSNSKGEVIYDDWEFGDFAGVIETGDDEIVLPDITRELYVSAERLAHKKYMMYKNFADVYAEIDKWVRLSEYDGIEDLFCMDNE
ncbi:MAG: hypothetical protein Q4E77_05115 [Conchiformibius sp.]|nr:hypothetical protein [Conchiformibius sp.]